ncbi:hypothetical protein JCM10212_004775 [Sporobolomyces blumeae]
MSHLKPLLPFSATSTPSTTSSLKSYPSSPVSAPTSPTSRTRRTLIPPRRVVVPLVLLSIASLLFLRSGTSTESTNLSSTSSSSWLSRWRSEAMPSSSSMDRGAATVFRPKYTAYTTEEMEERWKRATKPLPLEAGLEERLKEWEWEVPGDEVEPADWVRKNLETCPDSRIRPNQNGQMIDKAHLLWASMNSSRIMGLRREMGAYLREKEREGALEKYGEGRGLVFTAGNVDTFSRVLVTLKMLHNRLYSPLPSEIFSFPGEAPSDEVRAELESYGATLRVVETAVRDTSRTKNYHIKSTAIIRSRFREVLYLDSDNIPSAGLGPLDGPTPESVLALANEENRTATPWTRPTANGGTEEVWGAPAGLWEGKAYRRLGIMQWPDYWRTSADNPIWAILGVPCRDEWEQEAGQILVDKKYHLDALLLAEWMMDSSRFHYWFNFSDGDKDMFRFALLALRKRWAVPGRYVSVGALPRNTMSGFCGHTMMQHDHLGKPLFQHANLMKQIPSGVYKGFAWGRHRQIRTQPSTLRIPTRYDTSRELEAEDPLTDDDVDCDMLANAGDDGVALGAVPDGQAGYRTRRRAAMEKGIRAGFHGGWVSALCIDYHYDDPRTSEQIAAAKLSVAVSMPNPDNKSLSDLAADVDVCYCAAPDGFELRLCGEDLTEVVEWKDDPRLREFEEEFFKQGGTLNAKGF